MSYVARQWVFRVALGVLPACAPPSHDARDARDERDERDDNAASTRAFVSPGEAKAKRGGGGGNEARSAAAGAASRSPRRAIPREVAVGDRAAPWGPLVSTGGDPVVGLEALHGRVVLLEFWAAWCGPCRETVPLLARWQKEHGAEGLSVVGITTDPPEIAAAFAAHFDLAYPTASDPGAETTRSYGVRAIPTLVLIDRVGAVRAVHVGHEPKDDRIVEREVESLLVEARK